MRTKTIAGGILLALIRGVAVAATNTFSSGNIDRDRGSGRAGW